MSILIKGMEMPKDGCHHTICIYADGTVSTGWRVYMAVPVPPHGRLIDADAFFDDLLFPSKQFEQGMRELIGDAPTVIPAEEAPAEDTNVPTGPYDLLYEEGGPDA